MKAGYIQCSHQKKLTVDELCRFLHTIPGDTVVHVVDRRTDDREYVTVSYDDEHGIVRFE